MTLSTATIELLKTVINNSPAMITAAGGLYVVWRQNRRQERKIDIQDGKIDAVHNIVNGNTSRLLDKIPDANKDPQDR